MKTMIKSLYIMDTIFFIFVTTGLHLLATGLIKCYRLASLHKRLPEDGELSITPFTHIICGKSKLCVSYETIQHFQSQSFDAAGVGIPECYLSKCKMTKGNASAILSFQNCKSRNS